MSLSCSSPIRTQYDEFIKWWNTRLLVKCRNCSNAQENASFSSLMRKTRFSLSRLHQQPAQRANQWGIGEVFIVFYIVRQEIWKFSSFEPSNFSNYLLTIKLMDCHKPFPHTCLFCFKLRTWKVCQRKFQCQQNLLLKTHSHCRLLFI